MNDDKSRGGKQTQRGLKRIEWQHEKSTVVKTISKNNKLWHEKCYLILKVERHTAVSCSLCRYGSMRKCHRAIPRISSAIMSKKGSRKGLWVLLCKSLCRAQQCSLLQWIDTSTVFCAHAVMFSNAFRNLFFYLVKWINNEQSIQN